MHSARPSLTVEQPLLLKKVDRYWHAPGPLRGKNVLVRDLFWVLL